MKISLVIPAYNEERRLPATLRRIAEYLRSRPESWEVILADDGSRDGTEQAARETARTCGLAVRIIRLPKNRGKGAALRAGVGISTGDFVLLCDADLSVPIEEWEKLAAAKTPIAIGSRALQESRVKKKQPIHRRLMGKTFNKFVRLLSVRGIKDTQCGFKGFDGDIARSLFSVARIDRFAYDVEILALARRRGIAITEVPVLWSNSPESRVRLVRDSSRMLLDLIRIRFG